MGKLSPQTQDAKNDSCSIHVLVDLNQGKNTLHPRTHAHRYIPIFGGFGYFLIFFTILTETTDLLRTIES